jgi:hypothetical protein
MPAFEGLIACAVNAKLEAPDTSGTTPLILAAALGPEKDRDASVVKALLEKKADPHLKDSNGYSVSITLFHAKLWCKRSKACGLGMPSGNYAWMANIQLDMSVH